MRPIGPNRTSSIFCNPKNKSTRRELKLYYGIVIQQLIHVSSSSYFLTFIIEVDTTLHLKFHFDYILKLHSYLTNVYLSYAKLYSSYILSCS